MGKLLSIPAFGLVCGFQLLAAIARGEEIVPPDFFDIIGTPPAEVAASITRPSLVDDTRHLLSGFIGLPMSAGHRKEFVEGLQATLGNSSDADHFTVHCLIDLLEEEGRLDEAIALARSDLPKADDSLIREAGLLWKTGNHGDATALALSVSKAPANERAWLSMVKVDLIKGRPEEAMRQLAFFHQLAGLPPRIRHLLAIQHLEIARQQGQADPLLLSAQSPVLRAVWNSLLGRTEQALEAVGNVDPGVTAGEVGMLALALPGEPMVAERAKAVLARPDLPVEERRSLLLAFGDTRELFTLWYGMSGGHAETIDVLRSPLSADTPDEKFRDRQACVDLLAANPGDAGLKWLVAKMDPAWPQRDGPLVLEVARAFREEPRGDSTFADPAKEALEVLARTRAPEELRAWVVNAPGFAELPPQVRLRYLMAANLDREVIATVNELKFDVTSEDDTGVKLRQYLERRSFAHVVPDDVLTLLMERLPEMVVGSTSKPDSQVRDQVAPWLTFFGTHSTDTGMQVRAIRGLVAAAEARGPATRAAVMAGFPEFVWTLPGLALDKPPAAANRSPVTKAPAYLALSIFTPPDPAVIGQGTQTLQRGRFQNSSMLHRDPTAVSLLANSPWEQNLRGVEDRGRFDPMVQAKLRSLFDKFPSRTLIYDLLATSNILECPDPMTKAAADRRIAALDPLQQDDPSIALYLFFQRISRRTPPDECLPLLDGQENFTRPSQQRAMMRVQNLMRYLRPDIQKLIRERMGFKTATPYKKPPESLDTPSVYDRLQFFREAGKTDSPEAIALAREVLFAFSQSNRTKIDAEENIAISILMAAGQFPDFLDEIKAKLEAAGKSELEVQRAFYNLHLYRIVHSKGEALPFARRIFELDPSDTQAAFEVLGAATRADDPELALRCLEALGKQSHEHLRSAFRSEPGSPLELFTGARARELADALLRIPLVPYHESYRPDVLPSFLPLYLHIARHDPESLMPLMRWARTLTPGRVGDLVAIAGGLRGTLEESEILDLLADSLFTPPGADSPDAIRFPSKGILTDPESFNLAEFARSGFAKRLSEVAADYPPSDVTAGTKVLLQLAADPTPETWSRLIPGHLATLPVVTREKLRQELNTHVRNLPDSAVLQNFLAKSQDSSPEIPLTLESILRRLELAAKAGDRSGITALWESAKKLFPSATEQRRLDFVVRSANSLASLAELAVWGEFVEFANKTENFADRWIRQYANIQELSPSPVHVAGLARVILPQLKPDERNSATVLALFDLLVGTEEPDPALLGKFRPWIDQSIRQRERGLLTSPRGQCLDLLSSDPAAASPQIAATPQADGTGAVDWSLAGFKGVRIDYPSARPFPYLDGRFDLEILAGPTPERLARIASVPKAAATGRLNLKLPGDAKFISLLARQTEGGIVRWSHPVAIPPAPLGEAVELRPVAVGKPGVEIPSTVLPAGGPFRIEDARQFQSPPGVPVELARLPWTDGAAPLVSGWLLTPLHAGTIALSFRNADDIEISSQTLDHGDSEMESMPFWRRIKTPADLMAPPETVTVALVFKPGYSNSPSSFRVSELRVVPPQVTVLPEGFTLLGRMPGYVQRIALDSRGNRFAASSARSGVGVFDLATREFSGWIPLGDPARQGHAEISWLALAGDRLVCAERTGEVHLLSVTKRSARLIRKIDGIAFDRQPPYPVRLSPDGSLLAWSGIMAGLRIAKLGDDGIAGERLVETDRIHWMGFKPGTLTLEALGGDNTYTLDLNDWRNAPLVVRRNDAEAEAAFVREEVIGMTEPGRTWVDAAHEVTFRTGAEGGLPSGMDPGSRTVMLPHGLVAADRDGKPFFISNYGRVLRIETEKMEGYQPPVKK